MAKHKWKRHRNNFLKGKPAGPMPSFRINEYHGFSIVTEEILQMFNEMTNSPPSTMLMNPQAYEDLLELQNG